MQDRVPPVEMADGPSRVGGISRRANYHKWLKRQKARAERRKAKQNPECTPTYGRYKGWEL